MKFERTLITAALPYANGPVHIGHLAGVYIPADIYTRFLRLRGEDVIFVCGSDEHGVPVTIRASQEHITPQQVVDRYHNIIAKSFNEFGISFDIYSRTTSPIHHKFASDFFQHLHDKNIFIKKETEQFYDEQTHEFLTDRNIRGECPRCHAPNAYGDQCEKCGSALSPDELINPYNALNGNTLTKKKTSHWFLPLDQYQTWLEEWILQTHKDWRPNVYGQCKSWLDGGLNPRAVTRDLNWGIPVPVEGGKGKVLYVWFDAPLGYISNTIELCQQNPNKYGNWEKWWKDPQTRLIHFIGKDNIVFHCIVFPTMLKAAEDYILPDNVPANEFLNLEGDKISTSRNWAVWLNEYLVDFPDKQDTLRYVLTANAPETKDNDFTWKDFQARNNNELVAIYGNFINRTLVLTERYCQNNVPENGIDSEYDIATWKEFVSTLVNVTTNLENFHFRDALKEAMNLARIGNKYLAETEPWKIAKTDMSRVHTILYNSLQMIANLCITFAPFLPYSSKKLQKILKIPALSWNLLSKKNLLQPGTALEKAELLFDKIEDDVINNQIEKLTAIKKANESQNTNAWTPQPIKNEVSIEDFDKMDIRVATVLECSKVEKSNKLLRFVLQDGFGKRTILSGIAGSYSDPSVLIGKQVLYMANLPPRKMMGMESQGMILSALDKDGRLVLTTVSDKVQDGATVG